MPKFECTEYLEKTKDYVVLIPIINEGDRIHKELKRALESRVSSYADIVICDGGSSDGSTEEETLKSLDVNTLLVKQDTGKQGAQLRMGIWWALERGYKGIITIDGNNKDSIEDIPKFIEKLEQGYDFVQGSALINIWVLRYMDYSVVLPLTSLTYMWTMILSYLILKEKITKRKIVGVILVLIGAVFVSIKI